MIKKIVSLFCFLSFWASLDAQTPSTFYQQIVSRVSSDTVLANLQKLESLGKKEPGTAALDNTANWLISKYASFGYTNIVRDTFDYGGHQLYNLIITKYGTVFPPKYIIIDGHYDTYQGPGVNDNGSGVAVILEIARLLSNVQTAYSIKFINFSAEEEGLIGSQHYVDNTVIPTNQNIVLVFNIDEVGGVSGTINNTITCERDESNPSSNNAASYAFTDTLVTLTHQYSSLLTQINYAYGSDYVPFQEAGEVITGYYETNESPYVHSPNDLLIHMSPDYVTEIARAATGASLWFSQASPLNTSLDLSSAQNKIRISPNPARDFIRWNCPENAGNYQLRFYNSMGQLLEELDYSAANEPIADITKLPDGIISLKFSFENPKSNCTVSFLKSH